MILSIVRGDLKSCFGKKTKTWVTWKTDFKPNISAGKSRRIVPRKKYNKTKNIQSKKKKKKKKKKKENKNKREKEVKCKADVSFQ